jgi:hypothetical protein
LCPKRSWMIWVAEVGDELLLYFSDIPQVRETPPDGVVAIRGARIAVRSHDQAQKLYD